MDAAGPAADAIATLWWAMFWGAAVIFAAVMALLLLSLVRPGFGKRLSPTRWLLYGGLVFPSGILAVLLVVAFVQGEKLIGRGATETPLRIAAHGRMWTWEFSYPDIADAMPSVNVLHMPVGRPVELVVTSADVIHSFWIPRFGGKIDAIPGRANRLRLQVDRAGTYHGVCAEFCGRGHHAMLFTVEAHDEAAYRSAVTGKGAAP